MRVFVETERLILRRFTMDDLDVLCDLNSDPEVMRYTTGGLPVPRDEIERHFLPAYLGHYERYAGYGFWAAIEKDSGEFLGWFHFLPHAGEPPDQPELGYRLKRSAWGKGYATEGSAALIDKGFAELGARRVVASAFGENVASRRVMEKVGMRLARTFRIAPEELDEVAGIDPALFDGDCVEYAITKAEWDERRGREERSAGGQA